MTRFLLLYNNIIYIPLVMHWNSQNSLILTILNLWSKSPRFCAHPFISASVYTLKRSDLDMKKCNFRHQKSISFSLNCWIRWPLVFINVKVTKYREAKAKKLLGNTVTFIVTCQNQKDIPQFGRHVDQLSLIPHLN